MIRHLARRLGRLRRRRGGIGIREAFAEAANALAGDDTPLNDRIRTAARQTVITRYDLNAVCLPAYLDLLRSLLGAREGL